MGFQSLRIYRGGDDVYSDDRSVKRAKTDDDNHQSTNGDMTQSSGTVVTQQQVIQSSAAGDSVPAYTYAPTWPGYAVYNSVLYFSATLKGTQICWVLK